MSRKIIAIASGGLDSTTMVYMLKQRWTVDVISFDYGQRHSKELRYMHNTAEKLGMRHEVVDLSSLTGLLAESGSSLVSGTDVPEGHYAEDNMKATVVPNRNMIMLSIAGGIAVARDAEAIATAVHAGDHFIYPDCRPDFIQHVDWALREGNKDFGALAVGSAIFAPYIYSTKADIAYQALELGVPLEETWSCYKGGEKHCGRCGTCVERLEAIAQAEDRYSEEHHGAPSDGDKTEYEDSEYWKTVTK